MYAQVYTRPDIAYALGMLGRYQNNPGMKHWRAAKKSCNTFKGLRTTSLHTRDQIIWKWLDILILTLLDVPTL